MRKTDCIDQIEKKISEKHDFRPNWVLLIEYDVIGNWIGKN